MMSTTTTLHKASPSPLGRARQLGAIGIILLATVSGQANATGVPSAEPEAGTGVYPATSANVHGDDDLLLDQIFQSHLPTTLPAYVLRFSVHPHLGDWQNKDHLRLTTSLRYGLTKNSEISLSSNLYFSHGHGDVRAFENYGAANLQPGFKINLGQPLFSGWDTGIGANYEFPVGHPVPELTDGLRHFRPYITFSHRLAAHPAVRLFIGFHGDQISRTSLPGEFGKNAFHEGSAGLTGGWVIDRGNLHYTLEAAFDSTRFFSRTEEDIYSIRPGVIWEIPTRHNRQLSSNWMVGVSVHDTFGPGGHSLGASFRLRYTSDLKSRFRHTPQRPVPADSSP